MGYGRVGQHRKGGGRGGKGKAGGRKHFWIQTLKYNPDLVQAYRFLGESYKSLYKPAVETERNKEIEEKALEALRKAYEIDPMNKEVIYSLGDMYDKIRDFDSAEQLYLKILEMEPTNMGNYYVVAEFYKRYAGSEEEGEEDGDSYPTAILASHLTTRPNGRGWPYILIMVTGCTRRSAPLAKGGSARRRGPAPLAPRSSRGRTPSSGC